MDLSHDDASINLIVSNDVFEHIPDPKRAFQECVRVLRPGGSLLATMPFHSNADESVVRATLSNGVLNCLLPRVFHGNPVSAEGSLVFVDFGWDVLSLLREAGFSDASASIYASEQLAHLGGGQLIFAATKAKR
jgi:ubiquinone/menaquinone biosynthesis C-methylase UbiE